MNRRPVVFGAALAAAVLVVALLLGRNADGPPLDPASTGPLGTHALMALLDAFDVETQRGLPGEQAAVALLLSGDLTQSQIDLVDDWMDRGGQLVVVSPGSVYAEDVAGFATSGQLDAERCDLPELADVRRLEAASFATFVPTDSSCFVTSEGLAYVVVSERGLGRLIVVGGAGPFTNERLDAADNAVLALRLLDPSGRGGPGATVAVVFDPASAATVGERSLASLVPSRVRWMGWQLLGAFVVFALWKARRFGRVVDEPRPVELPGSLLVLSSGELRRRSGAYEQAMAAIRQDVDLRLRAAHRVPVEVSTDRLIDLVATRCGTDPARLYRALAEPLPPTAAGLTALLAVVEDLDTDPTLASSSGHPTFASDSRSPV